MEFLVVLPVIVTPSYVHISCMSVLVLIACTQWFVYAWVVINTAVAFNVCSCVSEGSQGFQEKEKQAPSRACSSGGGGWAEKAITEF